LPARRASPTSPSLAPERAMRPSQPTSSNQARLISARSRRPSAR